MTISWTGFEVAPARDSSLLRGSRTVVSNRFRQRSVEQAYGRFNSRPFASLAALGLLIPIASDDDQLDRL